MVICSSRADFEDLISLHQRRSRIASLSTTEYHPREINFVADYLAGQDSAYLLQLHQTQLQLPCALVYLDIAPPYELPLKNHAMIAGSDAGRNFVLTLLEMSGCFLEDLVNLMPTINLRVQRQLSQIVLAALKCTQSMVVQRRRSQ